MLAIEGLEDALLGTAYVAGVEVLAYDASVAEELVMFMDPPHFSLHEFVVNIGLDGLGSRTGIYLPRRGYEGTVWRDHPKKYPLAIPKT